MLICLQIKFRFPRKKIWIDATVCLSYDISIKRVSVIRAPQCSDETLSCYSHMIYNLTNLSPVQRNWQYMPYAGSHERAILTITMHPHIAWLQRGWYLFQYSFRLCVLCCQRYNSWTVKDVITKFSGQQRMVERMYKFEMAIVGCAGGEKLSLAFQFTVYCVR